MEVFRKAKSKGVARKTIVDVSLISEVNPLVTFEDSSLHRRNPANAP